jgi:biopolymer transport protein ExbD
MFDWDDTPELNITPLVDVMLVLLAILMVTAPTMVYEEMVQLPKGSKEKAIQKAYKIEIRITKDRDIYIKNTKYSFETFPDDFLLYSQNITKDTPVIITADERILYKDVMAILRSIKVVGFTKVSLSTNG